MAITTVDDIVAGLADASAQDIIFQKIFTNPKAAGAFQSSWLASGLPGAGAAPPAYTAGSGYTCDRTTTGAISFTNAAVQAWLAKVGLSVASTTGCLILADRLWSCSGMGFAAGTYTVTTPGSLPARITDNGIGVEAYVEQFVAAGAATGSLTLNYLDAATGAAKTGVIPTVVSAPVVGQMQLIPLSSSGGGGVRQVTSAVTSATWTSGSFGITLLKRICEIPITLANTGITFDWAQLGIPKIPNDACLFVYLLATGTTGPICLGKLDIIDK